MTAWRAISSAALALALFLGGCGASGGADQAPSRAYGRVLRPMPEGTVARSGGEPPLGEDPARLRSPIARTPDNVSQGRELCRIHCAPCHGPLGHGDGSMAALLGVEVRDLAAEQVAELTDGELYAVITRGSGQMLGLRGLIAPEDRWRCVLGVRDLARAARDSAAAAARP